MNIKFQQFLDYWVGIPSCFFLTIISKTTNSYHQICNKKSEQKPKKILVIKLSELGAVILSFNLLQRLKKEFAQSDIYYITFTCNREIFIIDNSLDPNNIITIRSNNFQNLIYDTFLAVKKCRKLQIDIVLDLEFFARFTAIISFLTRASKRVGFHKYLLEGLYRGNLLTHKIQYNPHLHMQEMYALFADVLKNESLTTPNLSNINTTELPEAKNISITEKQILRIKNKLKNAGGDLVKNNILFNPGDGKIPLREWPLENFNDLAVGILENKNCQIIIVGTKESTSKASMLKAMVNSPSCVNLAGDTSMEELLALMHISSALVTNDSGAAHLASLSNIPTFVLFGPETPKIFAPKSSNVKVYYKELRCSPCLSIYNHRQSKCLSNDCLKSIAASELLSDVKTSITAS